MVETPAGQGAPLRLVCFELRGQELALPIGDVRETLPIQPITRVVLTPSCLAGVFSLRGDIVPAIDLGVLLGLRRTEVSEDSRIVVVGHEGAMIGIVVDRLRELRTLEQPLEPPPPNLAAEIANMLAGVVVTTSGIVRVLDAHSIINAEPLRVLAGNPEAEGRTE
ncbi:MAG TPA: chemotaxis protein CheW [Kofleriaceae bacterium]